MFKSHFNRIQVVFLIIFSAFLPISIVYSYPFQTPKTCSDTWGTSCSDSSLDDALDSCNGIQMGASEHVREVYINASSFHPNDIINVTCEFQEVDPGLAKKEEEYIYYYNGFGWILIWKGLSDPPKDRIRYQSVTFRVNETEGTHWVRCIILRGNNIYDLDHMKYCANSPYTSSNHYDNDDVKFTVISDTSFVGLRLFYGWITNKINEIYNIFWTV